MDQPPHPRRSDLRDEGPETASPDRRMGRTPRAVARYVLDGTDEDLKRLHAISDLTAEFARIALHRVGVQEGWNAIECGCGPLGALPVLAEAVGSSGRWWALTSTKARSIERARLWRHLDSTMSMYSSVTFTTRRPLNSVRHSTWHILAN